MLQGRLAAQRARAELFVVFRQNRRQIVENKKIARKLKILKSNFASKILAVAGIDVRC